MWSWSCLNWLLIIIYLLQIFVLLKDYGRWNRKELRGEGGIETIVGMSVILCLWWLKVRQVKETLFVLVSCFQGVNLSSVVRAWFYLDRRLNLVDEMIVYLVEYNVLLLTEQCYYFWFLLVSQHTEGVFAVFVFTAMYN